MTKEELKKQLMEIYNKADKAQAEYNEVHNKYVTELKDMYKEIKEKLYNLTVLATELKLMSRKHDTYNIDLSKKFGYLIPEDRPVRVSLKYDNPKDSCIEIKSTYSIDYSDDSCYIGNNNNEGKMYEKIISEWDEKDIYGYIEKQLYTDAIEQATKLLDCNLKKVNDETIKYNKFIGYTEENHESN